MNVLITGANGFVGSTLLKRLIDDGRFKKIVAMHRSLLNEDLRQQFPNNISWVQANITTDDLSKIIEGIDIVFHLAAHSSVSETDAELKLMHEINVIGTQRVAIAAKTAKVKHFIFVSSIAACEFGITLPITEENGLPISSYGKSKRTAEDFLLTMPGDDFEITILRPTALFGENHLGSVSELAKLINRDKFVIFGSGSNRTNFYYIQDFIDVLLMVVCNKKSYGEVFIAADNPCPLNQFVHYVTYALGKQKPVLHIPLFVGYFLARLFDILSALTNRPMLLSKRRFLAMTRDIAYSNQKLQSIGIDTAYGINKGIQSTVSWYMKEGLV